MNHAVRQNRSSHLQAGKRLAVSMKFPDRSHGHEVFSGSSHRTLEGSKAAILSGLRNRLYPGAQLHVLLRGESVGSLYAGWARAGCLMSPATILPWFCNVKPLIAVAFAKLWESGLLSLDSRVSDFIPEFAAHGKAEITFRHILTHTAGVKFDPVRPIRLMPRDLVLDEIYKMHASPGMSHGRVAKYAVFWGWAVLCETIKRVTGLEYDDYINRSMLDPSKIVDLWLQMRADQVAAHVDRVGLLFGLDKTRPYPWPTKADLDCYDKDQPATSIMATAGSIALAYQGILNSLWVTKATTEALIAKHRVGLYCENFRGIVSWGLGMVVDGSYFGSYCSPRTFGHKGLNSSLVIVDPEYDLIIAFICNGLINGEITDIRDRLIVDCVYRDLGLGVGLPPSPRIIEVDESRSVRAKRYCEMPAAPTGPPRRERP
jgi:CubicO group peptidase (beta-lactamase class C family)